jgi:hypothetical protein
MHRIEKQQHVLPEGPHRSAVPGPDRLRLVRQRHRQPEGPPGSAMPLPWMLWRLVKSDRQQHRPPDVAATRLSKRLLCVANTLLGSGALGGGCILLCALCQEGQTLCMFEPC